MKASKLFLGLLEASQQLQPKSLFKAVGLEVVGRTASMGRLSSKGRLCTSALPNLSRWRQLKLLAVAAVRRFGGTLALKEKQHGGLKIQCLCNLKVIEEHELLTMPCPCDQAKSSTEAILQPKAAPKSKASRSTEPTVKAQPAKKESPACCCLPAIANMQDSCFVPCQCLKHVGCNLLAAGVLKSFTAEKHMHVAGQAFSCRKQHGQHFM